MDKRHWTMTDAIYHLALCGIRLEECYGCGWTNPDALAMPLLSAERLEAARASIETTTTHWKSGTASVLYQWPDGSGIVANRSRNHFHAAIHADRYNSYLPVTYEELKSPLLDAWSHPAMHESMRELCMHLPRTPTADERDMIGLRFKGLCQEIAGGFEIPRDPSILDVSPMIPNTPRGLVELARRDLNLARGENREVHIGRALNLLADAVEAMAVEAERTRP